MRRRRSFSTASSRPRRLSRITIERSCTVSGNAPMPASATGANTGKRCTVIFLPSPTTRATVAPRRYPALSSALKSSDVPFAFGPNTASTSSNRTVTGPSAITRNSAAGEMFATDNGAGQSSSSTSRRRVFPDCFSADCAAMRAVVSAHSIAWAPTIQSATATTCSGIANATKRRRNRVISRRTASGPGRCAGSRCGAGCCRRYSRAAFSESLALRANQSSGCAVTSPAPRVQPGASLRRRRIGALVLVI